MDKVCDLKIYFCLSDCVACPRRGGTAPRGRAEQTIWQVGEQTIWQVGEQAIWQVGEQTIWQVGEQAIWQVGEQAVWQVGEQPEVGKITTFDL